MQKHIDFVTKKEETGSTTHYEVLSTRVRLSNAENQRVDLETSRQTQAAVLNSLLGRDVYMPVIVKGSFLSSHPDMKSDSLISYALEHRYEMVLARLRQEHTELKYQTIRVQNNPTLGAFASAGFKNGYFPEMGKLKANWAGGIGLNVPVFDATRHKHNMVIANTEITMSKQDMEETSRNISTEVFQNQASLIASLKKIDQGILQVSQAEEALGLAAISFKSGAVTNLDLLDAETAFEESSVNLLKARIDCAISVVRLNVSLGKPIN